MSPNLALEAEHGDGVTKTDLFNLKKCGGLGDAATDSRHDGDFLPPKFCWTVDRARGGEKVTRLVRASPNFSTVSLLRSLG
jgi:hypothetical protein